MKTCVICETGGQSDETATCFYCGNGSWRESSEKPPASESQPSSPPKQPTQQAYRKGR